MADQPDQDSGPPPDAAAVAARVPAWAGARQIAIRPLPDVISLNNTSYRATVDGRDYVLRVASDGARWLGIRRGEERAALLAAADAGVAPPVLYADDDGNLVTQLVAGRHWEPADFLDPACQARAAEALRRLHAIRGVPADGSVVRRIEALLASAAELGLERPPVAAQALGRLRAFAERRRRDPRFHPGLTHGDLWQNNFLDDGERLWLVDWEFAGEADPLFDLATFCLSARYAPAQQEAFLAACGYAEPGGLDALREMQRAVFFFEGAWALVQHGLRGSAEYDYRAHAARMFERLEGWGL